MGQYDNWPPFREPLMEPLADYMARKQRRREYVAALERVAAAARAGQVVIVDAFTMRMVAPTDWLPGLAAALAALDALKQGRTDD